MSQSFVTSTPVNLVDYSNLSWSATAAQAENELRFIKTTQTETAIEWSLNVDNQCRGLASLSTLPWDSEQLGTTAARINQFTAEGSYREQVETKQALLKHVLAGAAAHGVRHLSIRIDAANLAALHVLEQAGFITVDSILTFAIDLSSHESPVMFNDFSLRHATEADAEAAAQLASVAYTKDRFHTDPSINSERANALHAEWVRNSCLGKAASAVLLAEDQTGLLGYVTCAVRRTAEEKMIGTIVLVATAPDARGRGVAYTTTLGALDWFRAQGCETVEVGTQLSNISASRLYEKCGFRLAGSSISLRMILGLDEM